jgi:hypothetical protein
MASYTEQDSNFFIAITISRKVEEKYKDKSQFVIQCCVNCANYTFNNMTEIASRTKETLVNCG